MNEGQLISFLNSRENSSEFTVLHYFCNSGKTDNVRFMLNEMKWYLGIGILDNYGRRARCKNHLIIVKLLEKFQETSLFFEARSVLRFTLI